MAEIQEIKDPMNEIVAILNSWQEAHNFEALVLIATKTESRSHPVTYCVHDGNLLLVEALLRKQLDEMEMKRRGLCEY